MSRQSTDNLYIELDYFTPEEYYTYEAIASSAESSEFTASAIVGVVKEAQSNLNSDFALTATISHIEGVDIVLLPFADCAASAEVIRGLESTIDSAFDFVADTTGGMIQNASADFVSEFSVSVSADKIVEFNSSADSTITLSVDAVANRSADIALDTLGNLSLQSDRLREYSADIAGEFTKAATGSILFDAVITAGALFTPSISVTALKNHTAILDSVTAISISAEKTVKAASSVTAVATVSVITSNTKEFASAISSSATLSASVIRINRQPMGWEIQPEAEIQTGVKKFGAGALGLKSTSTLGNNYLLANTTFSPAPTYSFGANNWTIDFWRYQTANVGSSYTQIAVFGSDINIRLLHNYDGTSSRFRLQYTDSSNNTNTNTGSATTLPLNQWNQIRIVGQISSSVTTNIAVWLNGTRVVQLLASNYKQGTGGSIFLYALGPYSSRQTYLDEFRLYNTNLTDISTISFTAPSSAFINDTNTLALLHLDTNILDDNTATLRSGSAALTSTAILSVTANKVVTVASTQSSAAALSGTANRVRDVNAAIQAQGFIVTVAGYRIDDLADFNSAFTLTAQDNYIFDGASTQSASANLTAVIGLRQSAQFDVICETEFAGTLNAVLYGNIDLTSDTAVDAQAQRLRGITAELIVEGSTLTVAGTEQTGSANLTAVSELSAAVVRTTELASDMNSAFAVSISVGEIVQGDSAMSAEFSQTAIGDRFRLAVISANSEFSQTVSVIKTAEASSTQSSEFAQTITVSPIYSTGSSLLVTITKDIAGNLIADSVSTEPAEFTQSASPVKTVSASMNGEAVGFAITAVAKTAPGATDMQSVATMTVSANAVFSQQSSQSAEFTQSATATRIQEYAGLTISGVLVDQPFTYVDDLLNTTINADMGPGAVISIWARKSSTDNTEGTLIYFGTGPIDYLALSYINSTSIRLDGSSFDGVMGVQSATWSAGIAHDTNWHHYFIIIRDRYADGNALSPQTPNRLNIQLFVDGVNRGIRTPQSFTDQDLTSPIRLGSSYNSDGAPTEQGTYSRFYGDMAQLWIGRFSDYRSATVTDFYNNGFVDLGSDGTLGGLLPAPDAYDSMNEPYSIRLIPASGDSITPATVPLPAPDMSARFICSAQAQSVQVVAAQLSSSAALTAQLTSTNQGSVDLTAIATLSAATAVNKPYSVDLSASADISIVTGNIVSAVSSISTEFTQTTAIEVIRSESATISSEFSVLAVTGVLGSAVANLSAQAQLTVSADRVKDVFIGVDSSCATVASAQKTAVFTATEAITTAVNVSVDKIQATRADLLSDFAVSTNAVKTARVSGTNTIVATVSAQPRKLVGVSANFTAFNSVLTAGRIIHLDSYNTYVIPTETRIYRITEETRIYSINPESRVNIIQGYNQ